MHGIEVRWAEDTRPAFCGHPQSPVSMSGPSCPNFAEPSPQLSLYPKISKLYRLMNS